MRPKFNFIALKLCVLMLFVFLFQSFVPSFTETFLLDSSKIIEIWRFLSSIFLHGDLVHLLYNLFALGLFGSFLEKFIGQKRFLIVFFVSGILANLFAFNFYPLSLGASGAIFGVIGALIVVRPGLPVFAFGMPMPIFLAGIFWAVGDLIGAVAFLGGNALSSTGNIAHLSGLVFGLIFGVFYRDWNKKKKKEEIEIDEGAVRKWEEYIKGDL